MKVRSLSGSLTFSLSAGLILIMLLQWLLVTRTLEHVTRGYVISRLEHDTESLLAALEPGPDGLQLLNPQRLNPTFSRPLSGHYYFLRVHDLAHPLAPDLELGSPSLWTRALPLQALRPGTRSQGLIPGPRSQTLLQLQQGLSKKALVIQLTVAEDLSPLLQALGRFSFYYALGSWFLLMLLLAVQRWLIGRLLAPLRGTPAEISRIQSDPDARLNENVPAEIQPLVQAFNWLLSIQQQRLERSRNRLGDLSHALKRPLSRILQLLESQPWPELEQEVMDMHRLIRHQLANARLAGSSPVMARLELEPLLRELLPALEKLYADKQLSFSLDVPAGLKLRMDRQDALELLGNLLDNACKWARGRIEIQARPLAGLELKISDDGPGAPPEILDQLTQRGVRADQQLPGHGLGLAIARDLVQSYGGRLELGPAHRLGGFQVRIRLPEPAAETLVKS